LTHVQTTLVPAGGATVVDFDLNVPGNYPFVDHALARLDRGQHVLAEGDGVLDASGRLALKIPLNIDDQAVSQVVTVEATLTDKNINPFNNLFAFLRHT
jgi:hypothetical protein